MGTIKMDIRKALCKTPSWIKLIILFLSGFIVFNLNALTCTILFFLLNIFLLSIHFTAKKTFAIQKPCISYGMMLYSLDIFQNIYHYFKVEKTSAYLLLKPDFITYQSSIRLAVTLQCVSLLYFTTTQLEIRYGITTIEYTIRKLFSFGRKTTIKPRFSQSLSLLLTFIPQVLSVWTKLDTAWKARGGKNGIKKMTKLLPVLISVSMHNAYQTAMAVSSRDIEDS